MDASTKGRAKGALWSNTFGKHFVQHLKYFVFLYISVLIIIK